MHFTSLSFQVKKSRLAVFDCACIVRRHIITALDATARQHTDHWPRLGERTNRRFGSPVSSASVYLSPYISAPRMHFPPSHRMHFTSLSFQVKKSRLAVFDCACIVRRHIITALDATAR
eukprot:EG_transcript_57366